MDRYNIVYLNENNLYVKGSPVLIRSRAIVNDIETGRKHFQIKLKNIGNKRIIAVKAKAILFDVYKNQLEIIEKQYFGINVGNNEEFASDIPVYLNNPAAAYLDVAIKEVYFQDSTVWTCENERWEEVAKQRELIALFNDNDIVEEFQYLHGKTAQYEIVEYGDIWFCTCGCVNSNTQERCFSCNTHKLDLKNVDINLMKKNSICRKARQFIDSDVAADIEKGIRMLESLPNYAEYYFEIMNAREKLASVQSKEEEKKNQIRAAQKKKQLTIRLTAVAIALVFILTAIISIVVVNKKREPFYTLKECAVKYGGYDNEDGAYSYILNSVSDYHAFLKYNEEDEVVILSLYANGDYQCMTSIEIDKKSIMKKEYKWTFIDEYGNEMEGVLDATTFSKNATLTYTYTDITSSSVRNSTLSVVRTSIGLYFTLYKTEASTIGVTQKDLGFILLD